MYLSNLFNRVQWESSVQYKDGQKETTKDPKENTTKAREEETEELSKYRKSGELMEKFRDLINLGKELGFKVNVYEMERYNGNKTYKADVVVGKKLFLFPDRRYLGSHPTALYLTDMFQDEFKGKEEIFTALKEAINKHFEGELNKVKRVRKVKVGSEV